MNLRTFLLISFVASLYAAGGARGQISISGPTTYAENFDLLGTLPRPWVDGSSVPPFFAAINPNITVDGNLTVSDGTIGDLFGLLNLGLAGDADRALGSKVTLGLANIAYGVLFRNTSPFVLEVTNITYTGELWRSNTTASSAEQWLTFTKTSPTLFTDPEPGPSGPTATAGTFIPAPLFNWTAPSNLPASTALNGNLAANRLTISGDPDVRVASGEYFMFRWVDTNLSGTDGHQGIDDFSITFGSVSGPLVYNLAHTVGGAPNGTIEVSPRPFWLRNGAPSGFAANDELRFSQSGSATIVVPAPVTASELLVNNASGLYTLQTDADLTVSRIDALTPFRKTGAAQLIVGSGGVVRGGIEIAAGHLTLDSTAGMLIDMAQLTGAGGVRIIGTGTVTIGGGQADSTPNTFTGTTTVVSGTLVAQKASGGVNVIGGDLVIEAAGRFRYASSFLPDQLPDTATVTINGGIFGDPEASEANQIVQDTIANVILNGGTFASGRNFSGAFTITDRLRVNGGTALAKRGGTIAAREVTIGAGVVNLDGGATSGESGLSVGEGGLELLGGTINFNSGPSVITATSLGSVLKLDGDVSAAGTSRFVRQNTIAPARVDLLGEMRTFDISGTLEIGSVSAPVEVTNGGLRKTGTGTLKLAGAHPYGGNTVVEAGTLQLAGSLLNSAQVEVRPGATLRPGVTFASAGFVAFATTVASGGTLAPGSGALTFNTLTLGTAPGETPSDDAAIISFMAMPDFGRINVSALNGLILLDDTVLDLGSAEIIGQQVLIDYSGSLGGAGFAAFSVTGAAPGFSATLVHNTANTSIDVLIVPEPGAASLLVGGLLTLVARCGRFRRGR